MLRSLVPFRELTRSGVIPEFRVCRIPLVTSGVEIQVGEVVAPSIFGKTRVRQLYEQRRIEPVIAPLRSKQSHRPHPSVPRSVFNPTADFDAPDVPVVEVPSAYTSSYKRSTPSRKGATK